MDVWSLTRAALRRWYVLLPALLVTGLLVASAGRSVAPEYETTGAALLVQPSIVTGPNNPYAASSGPEVLRIIVSGSSVRSRLAAQGMDPSYELAVTNRTPIFNVRVRSGDRERALATGEAVIDALRQELAYGQQQSGIPEEAMATIQVIDAPDAVSTVGGGATRVKAVVAFLGLAASVALAVTFDDVLLLLSRRRPRTTGHSRPGGSPLRLRGRRRAEEPKTDLRVSA